MMKNSLRCFPSILCALFMLAFISGCGKREQIDTPNPGTEKDLTAKTVRILTWRDYFSPEICEQFSKESGLQIEWRYYENLGEMNALLRSEPDGFDVMVVDDMSLTELIETKLLAKIDKNLLPEWKNIDERYTDKYFDPGNAYSVPYMWGTTLVAYRKDKVQNPEESWNLLWDERLKGKILMLNEKSDIYAITLQLLGIGFGAATPENLEKCTAKLLEQVEKVEVDYTDIITAKEKVLTGEYWAFLAYSGDAAILKEENPDIAYFIPREGAPLWLDSFAIPREARNVRGAHAFINFMSRPDIAAENANFLSYATANKAALSMVNEELLQDRAIYPAPEVLSKCDFIPRGSFNDYITNQGMKLIFDALHRRQAEEGAPTPAQGDKGAEP